MFTVGMKKKKKRVKMKNDRDTDALRHIQRK